MNSLRDTTGIHLVLQIFTPIDVQGPSPVVPPRELPPYNGFGSIEDSKGYCLKILPQPPKKDFVKMLENDKKLLRYELQMISYRPEDERRKFIMTYNLADDMLKVHELTIRNLGRIGGKFLSVCRVPKAG